MSGCYSEEANSSWGHREDFHVNASRTFPQKQLSDANNIDIVKIFTDYFRRKRDFAAIFIFEP